MSGRVGISSRACFIDRRSSVSSCIAAASLDGSNTVKSDIACSRVWGTVAVALGNRINVGKIAARDPDYPDFAHFGAGERNRVGPFRFVNCRKNSEPTISDFGLRTKKAEHLSAIRFVVRQS